MVQFPIRRVSQKSEASNNSMVLEQLERDHRQAEEDMSESMGSVQEDSATNFGSEERQGSSSDNLPNREKKVIEQRLGRNETNAVRKLRVLFLVTLFSVAVGSSVLVYLYTKNTEEKEFISAFKGHGQKVLEAFQDDSVQKMQALESLSSTITSSALEHNMTWPLVTVANSARLFGPYLRLADAASLVLMPIVGARQRAEWERHAQENQGWIEEDLGVSARRNLQYNTEAQMSPYIKNYVGVDTSTGPWCVWWQVSLSCLWLKVTDKEHLSFQHLTNVSIVFFEQYAPVIENRWFINFNRLALKGFQDQLSSILSGSAAISPALTFEPGLDMQSTRDFRFTQQLLQAGGTEQYVAGEPLSYIDYPVFDNWSDSKKAVAVLSATIFWRSYLTGVLPENVKLIAVIENNKEQAFTYKIE